MAVTRSTKQQINQRFETLYVQQELQNTWLDTKQKKVLKEEKIYVNCVAPHLYFFKLIIAEFLL